LKFPYYQSLCYKVITTYCSEKTQKERALRRKNIDNKRLEFIIKRQMASNIKAKLTDYLVYTDISYAYTEKQIEEILFKEGIK
jgi:dephospho-CoA kinase